MSSVLSIDCKREAWRIIDFIRITVYNAGFKKVILGLSGGVDSSTVAFLSVKALGKENVFLVQLPYRGLNSDKDAELVIQALKIPQKNIFQIDIKPVVENIKYLTFNIKQEDKKVRLGNIMARVRMIFLYDLAKANKALVCGTENKSEHLLGYYTLHGDSASDLEPIKHLYKTQVIELAKYLGVPKKIINKPPTAGLWLDQTDEKELGFSYKKADNILHYIYDRKYKAEEVAKLGFSLETIEKIRQRVSNNSFKEKLPCSIS